MAWYKFVAKLSHFTFWFLKGLTDFLDTVFAGFWLGLMGENSLDYSDEMYYNQTNYYREDEYNQSGLFEWEKAMIEKHFSNRGTILLIAAGGGREVLALIKMGFEVDSYECNPALIEFGNRLLQKNNIESKIRYLQRNSVPGKMRKYDGIIIGWGAYSLIAGIKKRLTFLAKLHPFLKEDSRLMISFLRTEKRSRKEKIIKNISNFFRIFRNIEKTELGDRLVPSFVHYFNEEEIKGELIQSGYRVIDYYSIDYGCVIAGI